MPKVAIVGAGLAGLTAAIYLERNGADVTVYEASDRIGGRVRTDVIDGFRCDHGFQVINPNYSEIRRLNALAEIDFAPINTNVKINGVKYGTSHLINDIKALPNLRDTVLDPFLTGVFLTQPKNIHPKIAKEILRSFVFGRPGVPKLGVSEFSEGLADRVSTIELNSIVQSVKNGRVKGNFGTQNYDAVIVATDAATSVNLTGIMDYEKILPSTTWYHATRDEIKDSKYLNIDQNSKLVNSVVISEVSSQYAPKGYSLIASTALSTLKETEVKKDLAQIWGASTKPWELVARYDIKNSLPLRKSPHISGAKISDKLYVAGDYLDLPSQNGAMRSGRRAALEVIKDLNLH